MEKEVKVIFSPESEKSYIYLNEKSANSKTTRSVFNAVLQKADIIKENIHYGDPIAKDLIPLEYKIKYGITNLFRVELPNFWRMLYTLTNDENSGVIITFIIDILDHKEYDKKFRYRKK